MYKYKSRPPSSKESSVLLSTTQEPTANVQYPSSSLTPDLLDPLFISSVDASPFSTSHNIKSFFNPENDTHFFSDDSCDDVSIDNEALKRLNFIKANPFSVPYPQPVSNSYSSLVKQTPRTMRKVLTGKTGVRPVRPQDINYTQLNQGTETFSGTNRSASAKPFSKSVSQTVAQLLSKRPKSEQVSFRKQLISSSHEGDTTEEHGGNSNVIIDDESNHFKTVNQIDVIEEADLQDDDLSGSSEEEMTKVEVPQSLSKQKSYIEGFEELGMKEPSELNSKNLNNSGPSVLFAGPQRSSDDLIHDPFKGLFNSINTTTLLDFDKIANVKHFKLVEGTTKSLLEHVEKSLNDSKEINRDDVTFQIGLLNELKIMLENFDHELYFQNELKTLPDYLLRERLLNVTRDYETIKSKIGDYREMNSLLDLRLQKDEPTLASKSPPLSHKEGSKPQEQETVSLFSVNEDLSVSRATNTYSLSSLKLAQVSEVGVSASVKTKDIGVTAFIDSDLMRADVLAIPSYFRSSQSQSNIETDQSPRADNNDLKAEDAFVYASQSRRQSYIDYGDRQSRSPSFDRSYTVSDQEINTLVTHTSSVSTQASLQPVHDDFHSNHDDLCLNCEALKVKLAVLEDASSIYTKELNVVKQRLSRSLSVSNLSFSFEDKESQTNSSKEKELSICNLHFNHFFSKTLPSSKQSLKALSPLETPPRSASSVNGLYTVNLESQGVQTENEEIYDEEIEDDGSSVVSVSGKRNNQEGTCLDL
ncbi:hypothetical protein GEMRC1_004515 [Eukaryota sp. GEM-RC1]